MESELTCQPELRDAQWWQEWLTADDVQRVKAVQVETKRAASAIVVELGLMSEEQAARTLADALALDLVASDAFPDKPLHGDVLSPKFLRAARVLPLREDDDALVLAMADPTDDFATEGMAFVSGKTVRRCVARPSDIEAAIETLYGGQGKALDELFEEIGRAHDEDASADLDRIRDLASEAPVVRLVNHLIARALEARASDIHIEPMEGRLRVRYRIDGHLRDVESPPRSAGAAVISRLKIMAALNIAERRLPQDGRIRLTSRGRQIDIRVSTTPTNHGESVVLRLLDQSSVRLDFEELGFADRTLPTLQHLLRQPHGILLVTGPTGSGKTTTLYAALEALNDPDTKILTIEDPIEYMIDGINQSQVKPQIGLTFASALRSYLRQDPDIMMVGEIRDLETAETAVQAALTGHLILSTLHTNDAPSAVTRLLDMGIDDFLIASTVIGVEAQRLVRKLCERCRVPYEPEPELVEKWNLATLSGMDAPRLYGRVGCDDCDGTGFHGRVAIVELFEVKDAIRSLIMNHAGASELRTAAIDAGMETMVTDGLRKAVAGITTIEEVLRATRDS